MQTHKSYRSYLLDSLADQAEAAAYLDAAFEDGDKELILVALRNIAEARSLQAQSSNSQSNWLEILDTINSDGSSELSAIFELLTSLGLRLSVSIKDESLTDVA